MRKRLIAGLAAVMSPIIGANSALACETIAESDEISDLSIGDIVYGDLSATVRIRIKSIDIAGEEICGRANGSDLCYDADELYSSEGVADCNADALSAGVIYLYGDEPVGNEEPPDATANGPPE